MPGRSDHVDQAERNEAVYDLVYSAKHHDWAATSLFYAALHWVEAFRAPDHGKNHSERLKYVATDRKLRRIYPRYRELYDRSREARYDCGTFTAARSDDLKRKHFDALKSHIKRLLGT